MVASSQVAFFSLSQADKQNLKTSKSDSIISILKLLDNPDKLLSTLVIANYFTKIGLIILSFYINNKLFDFFNISHVPATLLKILLITLAIIFFAEIIPKAIAAKYVQKTAFLIAHPVLIILKIFSPVSSIIFDLSSFISKKISGKKREISIDDLSNALELTPNSFKDNKKILKGIVSYGSTYVSEIMKPRVDIIAFSIYTSFNELLEKIKNQNYSRIPVFIESFDQIKGVLFVKDLLPHFHKQNFNWQSLIRPVYFVPESKKINDLLLDFQTKKIHMAIVIDEYGGTNGIVTLEDVLEEIVGEIVDEFDYEEEFYKKLDNSTYVFEGKTLINDFYKIMKLEGDFFDEIRGEADTLAGLILETTGEIPKVGYVFKFRDYIFKIITADKRRIKQIHVTFQINK